MHPPQLCSCISTCTAYNQIPQGSAAAPKRVEDAQAENSIGEGEHDDEDLERAKPADVVVCCVRMLSSPGFSSTLDWSGRSGATAGSAPSGLTSRMYGEADATSKSCHLQGVGAMHCHELEASRYLRALL